MLLKSSPVSCALRKSGIGYFYEALGHGGSMPEVLSRSHPTGVLGFSVLCRGRR